jgi:hypothetical protein
MEKAQFGGMKVVARVAGKGMGLRIRKAANAIERITYKRVPCSGQVDADLVGPTCSNAYVAEEGICSAFEDDHMRQGGLSFRICGID